MDNRRRLKKEDKNFQESRSRPMILSWKSTNSRDSDLAEILIRREGSPCLGWCGMVKETRSFEAEAKHGRRFRNVLKASARWTCLVRANARIRGISRSTRRLQQRH